MGHSTRKGASLSRRELVSAWLGVATACAALPLTAAPHGPEVAAVLMVASLARLAGHRWALAMVVLAQFCLVAALAPSVWNWPPDVAAVIVSGLAASSLVPALSLAPRAARRLTRLCGYPRDARALRLAHWSMVLLPAASLGFAS